jgi:hypothetical protein
VTLFATLEAVVWTYWHEAASVGSAETANVSLPPTFMVPVTETGPSIVIASVMRGVDMLGDIFTGTPECESIRTHSTTRGAMGYWDIIYDISFNIIQI